MAGTPHISKIPLLVGSAAILAIAGCNKPPQNEAAETLNATGKAVPAATAYYTVTADDITNAKLTAVSGTFQMLAATAATGIQSSGSGGACLVFTAKDLGFSTMDGKKCTSNTDCSNPPTSPADDPVSYTPPGADHPENRFGYCDTKNKQCWSKPIEGNDAVCNRPLTMTAGTVNPVPKAGPIDVSKWVKQGAKVRTVTCLNKGSPPFPGKPPCAEVVSADRIEVMGKPATLHK